MSPNHCLLPLVLFIAFGIVYCLWYCLLVLHILTIQILLDIYLYHKSQVIYITAFLP